MKKNGFAPILILLIIIFLGVAGYVAYNGIKSARPEMQFTPTPVDTNKSSDTASGNSSCEIVWVNPVLPQQGKVEPLFLKDVKGVGYEGIVRRQVEDGGYISVDLVTNSLPEGNSPYYLWAVAVDSNGNICSQSNLGSLGKISTTGSWGAGPFTLPLKNVNDAQLFVITQKGFGANGSDKISGLSDPAIILEGAYEDTHK